LAVEIIKVVLVGCFSASESIEKVKNAQDEPIVVNSNADQKVLS
jgi:hypothetical protein